MAMAAKLLLSLHFILPGLTMIPQPFHLLGFGVIAVALTLFGWSILLFQLAGTAIKPFQESTTLIINGPYQISRNPIYLAMAMILFGLAILLGTLTPFIAVLGFVFLIDRVFIQAEETHLKTTFPDKYPAYCRQVRRWV